MNPHKGISNPVYRRIRDDLCRRIRLGEWGLHSPIPKRTELAQYYGVARKTIEQAIAPLLKEGILQARRRSGTIVCKIPPPPPEEVILQQQRVKRENWYPPREMGARTVHVIGSINPLHLGYFLDHGEAPWLFAIMEGVRQEAEACGYRPHFINAMVPWSGEVDWLGALASLGDEKDCPLIIATPEAPLAAEQEVLSTLHRFHCPVVLIPPAELATGLPQLYTDHLHAGVESARHVHQQGCRRMIGVFPFLSEWEEQRLEGIREYTAAHRIAFEAIRRPEGCQDWDLSSQEGRDRYVRWVIDDKSGELDGDSAFICANDIIAVHLLAELRQVVDDARKLPLVTGFDDTWFGRKAGLTTFAHPLEEFGRYAVRTIHAILHGRPFSTRTAMPPRLIARESTQRLDPEEVPHDTRN
ncbi:MAG: GntR family transcriptional regulator [Lentisphaerae bacterium]|nr:MAG: GntR family transcriptional regulator [Lentisphaerota bacterium]